MEESSSNLIYVIAFDVPGSTAYHNLAKMLVLSLLKVRTNAHIVVLRNSDSPLFLLERRGVTEVEIRLPSDEIEIVVKSARAWKYRARKVLADYKFKRLLYLDADSLVTENLDSIFFSEGDWDIKHACYANGAHSSAFVLSEPVAIRLLKQWDEDHSVMDDHEPEHGAFRNIVENAGQRARPLFASEEESDHQAVQMMVDQPFVHPRQVELRQRMRILFAYYSEAFWYDDSLTLVNLFDA